MAAARCDFLQWMGPDYLKVVESDLDWRGFPIYVPRNYFIYVGRDAAKPVHGHMIKFSFHPYQDELDVFLQRSVVTWTDEGVELSLQAAIGCSFQRRRSPAGGRRWAGENEPDRAAWDHLRAGGNQFTVPC